MMAPMPQSSQPISVDVDVSRDESASPSPVLVVDDTPMDEETPPVLERPFVYARPMQPISQQLGASRPMSSEANNHLTNQSNIFHPPVMQFDANMKINQSGNYDAKPAPNGDLVGVIATGGTFSSFEQFENVFNEWKRTKFHPFRVASSETLRDASHEPNSVFKYRYIVYHCAHYGQPRRRGAGKRPNQSYLPCGCKAMLRLNYSWGDNHLRITTLVDQHIGHEVDAESFQRFSCKIRRSLNTSLTPTDSDGTRSPNSTSSSSPRSRANSFGAGAQSLLAAAQKTGVFVPSPQQAVQQILSGAPFFQNSQWQPQNGTASLKNGANSAFSGFQPPTSVSGNFALHALQQMAGQQMMQQHQHNLHKQNALLAAVTMHRQQHPVQGLSNAAQATSLTARGLSNAAQATSIAAQATPIDLSGKAGPSSSPIVKMEPSDDKENCPPSSTPSSTQPSTTSSSTRRPRDRSAIIRAVVSTVSDQLANCTDQEFDSRVTQLGIVSKEWQVKQQSHNAKMMLLQQAQQQSAPTSLAQQYKAFTEKNAQQQPRKTQNSHYNP